MKLRYILKSTLTIFWCSPESEMISGYRNKGYDFTITSSTAFDHKWIRGKNTFDTINEVVDELFSNYLSRPNVTQPILTQYCDGKRVSCPEWMTQLQVRIKSCRSLILWGLAACTMK